MPPEPALKRTIAFIDGQNLFHAVRSAFGYTYPNYNASALTSTICKARGWQLVETRFYTGVPDSRDDLRWHSFWLRKLAAIGRLVPQRRRASTSASLWMSSGWRTPANAT